ncbi:hypothetical protein DNTS_015148 [Danionella cerebrum]|uniref:Protein kinase domain-containing protein n=1 Tax=Danionella cerebrum TaxID=2873325 RepID=A0A553RGW4_9TELE|nr:hypothetical protein DNTS_015148 [Danionella translucida]
MKDPQLPGSKALNAWAKRHVKKGKKDPAAQPHQPKPEPRKLTPALTSEQRAKQTPLERLVYDTAHSERIINDIILGRRIGFYELRGELGVGNFSQVKLAVHDLTKGTENMLFLKPND